MVKKVVDIICLLMYTPACKSSLTKRRHFARRGQGVSFTIFYGIKTAKSLPLKVMHRKNCCKNNELKKSKKNKKKCLTRGRG